MDWALEATNEYEFNELFLDSFFDTTIPFTSAFEEAGADTNANSTQSNTTTQNNSSTNTNNTANVKGDEKQSPEEAKKSAGLIEKIKQLFARLMEIVAQAATNFKSKLTYYTKSKKQYEKEITDLEKRYNPRFDVIKKNRKYDYSYQEFSKMLIIIAKLVDTWRTDMNTMIDGYRKVNSDNSKSVEDYNKLVEEIEKKSEHQNIVKYIATNMGPAYNKIENFGQLAKAIQAAQRGATPGSLETPESEDMTLDQTLYNAARNCIKTSDRIMQQAHQTSDKIYADLNQINNKAKMINNTNGISGVQKSVSTMMKVSKEINTLLSLDNHMTALMIETMTNASMVCKACLVGGNSK